MRRAKCTNAGTDKGTRTPRTRVAERRRRALLLAVTYAVASCSSATSGRFAAATAFYVIDELRPLEAKYVDALTVIGVHSPKFEYEADASMP